MGDLRDTGARLHAQGHQWLKREAELAGMVLWAVGITTLAWTLDHAGPMTKSVADAATLLRAESLHVRSVPIELTVPIGRCWVREPNHFAADVLVEIAFKIKGDLERFLAATRETNPTGDLPWGPVVEISVNEVFIWSPCHMCGIND